jgi:hypothetical protein
LKNQKNNGGLVALVIILLVLVLCLGGYIVYDKVLSNNSEPKTEDNTAVLYSYDLTKRTTNQATREGYIEVLADTDGNAYLYTSGNLDYETDSQLKANIKKLEEQFETYSPKGYDSYGSTELKAYKLNMTNVLTTYYVHIGNGGSSYFIFVKENGKLSYLSYDKLINNGEIELKDADNIENVVAVVENTYTMTPYAITSNGSEISLYDYIK